MSTAPIRISLALGLIVLVAAALRFHNIGHYSLWVDEIASLMLSSGRPLTQFDVPRDRILRPGGDPTATASAPRMSEVWDALRRDTHPPLYLFTLRVWRSIFGDGDAAARSLSGLCLLASILLLYDTARLLHGPIIALWAAGIMAVATPQIEFSQEVRSYAMLVMWTLASCSAIVRIDRLGPSIPHALYLGIALFAAMLTHYYALACVAAVFVYALIRFRPNTAQRNASLIAIATAAIMFAIICGPLLWAQRANFHNNMNWIADDEPRLLWRTLYRVSILPLHFFIAPMKQSMYLAPLSAALFVVPWLMLRRRPDLLLWCLLAAFTVALPAAADLGNGSQTLNKIRYTLPAAAAIYAIAAALLAHQAGLLRHAIPAALVVSCLAALPQAYVHTWKPDWRGFAQQLADRTTPDHVLVLYQTDAQDWYQPMLHAGLVRYADLSQLGLVVLTEPADEAIRRELSRAPGAWVLSGEATPPIARFLPNAAGFEFVGEPFIGQAVRVRLEPAATTTATSAPASAPRETPR